MNPFSGGSRYVSGIRNGAMSYVKNDVTAFAAAAKGAVSPGVHIVIFSCDAFLLRISFRYRPPSQPGQQEVSTLRALADQNDSGQAEPSGDTKTKFTLTEKRP
ncbi:hypothetical protein [Enterobacter cloacae complex sp. 411G8]